MKIYYSSDEMFSSTDLIRKSKPIFDALGAKTIDKAVILRDGKPSFIMLDFFEYEKMMKEYMQLKNSSTLKASKTIEPERQEPQITQIKETEIDEEEYKKALDDIDNLDLDSIENENQKPQLKEFWDE